MRESSATEDAKLPTDTYEGWLRTQRIRHRTGAPEGTPAKDSYEVWLEALVEKRRAKTAAGD